MTVLRDFWDRLVRQPVAVGAAMQLVLFAAFPRMGQRWEMATIAVIAAFVKMYSTSARNVEDEKAHARNETLAEVASLAAVPLPPPLIVATPPAGTTEP